MRVAIPIVAAITSGCLPPLQTAATNVIDLQYRSQRATSTTIDLYRWAGSRSGSVQSRCKMAPTDSEMFAIRSRDCGGVRSWYWGVARVFLEQGASSRFLPHVRVAGRWRWVDLPATRCD